MGSRLENVKRNVEQANEIESRGIEEARKDASEVSEVKSVLDGMNKEVDDDIQEAIEATREAAKSEGAAHMNSEVHSTLDEGYNVANEAIQEGTDQAGASREAASDFRSASSASEFGRNTAENSASTAENLAEEFQNNAETAQESMDRTEEEFQELLSNIES